MAQKINLRAEEYQTIMSELANMHENHRQNVDTVMTVIKNVVTCKEDFWADLTSNKMVDILDMISNDIISLLEQTFRDSEAGVADMIEVARRTDSTCS